MDRIKILVKFVKVCKEAEAPEAAAYALLTAFDDMVTKKYTNRTDAYERKINLVRYVYSKEDE